ncbi:DUF3095 domain-containing protein [Flavobacterium silvaticum]|uniref:DUF3095 domain-containing protein n=1 Tax=Flavobacterium silvaticum TaxID=1852020 RepID=A0A972FRY1_9FLAO|nr:DUF3095 domain-containing protein [Flavobacterium silvaticum]NMH26902.1 DUF3095 domain-containing protein [Flavobacterium silvaticum]
MTQHSNDTFYSELPSHKIPLPDFIVNDGLFTAVPDDWQIVITDIVGSTNSVLEGMHQQVNLIATGSIVAVLNIAFANEISIPFFFGGDGATFLIPSSLLDETMKALAIYRSNTFANFNLELRTGVVSVSDVYKAGHRIKIARFKSSATFIIPIVLENGLAYAESIVKGENYLFPDMRSNGEPLNLDGMQCRWDKIGPPQNKEEIVTLLVVARENGTQAVVFKKVLEKLDSLYGSHATRQPISVDRLKFQSTFMRIGNEMRLRFGKIKWIALIRSWFFSLYVKFYFTTNKGQDYLKSLVEMSDTLVIDGKINTVISGNASQRRELEKLLGQMEAEHQIFYGWHISNASIMSCYVRDQKDGHIHFVDGSEGGYTKAAQMLKQKIRIAAQIS